MVLIEFNIKRKNKYLLKKCYEYCRSVSKGMAKMVGEENTSEDIDEENINKKDLA